MEVGLAQTLPYWWLVESKGMNVKEDGSCFRFGSTITTTITTWLHSLPVHH